MSETNQLSKKPPSEKEKPDEPAGEEKFSDISVDTSKKDSDVSMLEDEEMPTYSSISSSAKPNNSVTSYDQRINDVPEKKNRTSSPEPSEDQDNDDNESIYVVSSTADTDRNPDDIEDEEEEDYDSEDMNEEDEEDEDDEDDDGQDEYDGDRFERDSDDFEQDRFERASDDFVLRHNDSIKKYYKERSLSLQDLTTIEARYNRRRNFPRHNYYGDASAFKPNVYSPYALNSKPYQGAGKYEHIESKVKRYIKNIKEQEKLTKLRNPVNTKDSKDCKTIPVAGGKQIKEYAEKVIKELEQDEFREAQHSNYATLERMENGDECEPLKLRSEKISTDENIPMEIDHSPIKKQVNDKFEKVNGFIEFSAESEVTCTPIPKEISLQRVKDQVNGSEPSKNLINLRSLSYEEYMRGDVAEVQEVEEVEDVEEDEEVVEEEEEEEEEEIEEEEEEDEQEELEPQVKVESTEICLISPEKTSGDPLHSKQNNTNVNNSIKITNLRSNCHDLSDDETYNYKNKNSIKMINQATETIKVENSEIKILQASLTQRNSQFENLQIAFQKTLSENLAIKQELDSLKKILKKHEECENRETKCTSVQTEKIGNVNSEEDKIIEEKDKIKMSTSSLTSAISSIHQWSESGFSPSISVASPDVRKNFNSDDSVFEKTPKHPRTLSRAFVTSSRILQTLSNITQKKWNASSPISQDHRNQEVQSTGDPSTSGTPLNSKKRKATEMLGVASSEQPFKIPHTAGSGGKKIIQDSNNENCRMNGLASQNEDSINDAKNFDDEEEKKMKKELGDNLKYYIYQDEENSKERNFLIQAEETGNIPNKGTVRECGPYLLGNLEVRMTEVNGTINIWGKEINVDSTEEESNLSGKSAEVKSSIFWQKTAQTNLLNNSFMSSTNKNSKLQSRFNDSSISQLSHSFEHNIPKHSIQMSKQSCHRRGSLPSDDNCSSNNHRLSWSGCKHLMEEQKHYHSRPSNSDCESCNCVHNERRCECHSCNKIRGCADNIRRHSFSGGSNKTSMDVHCVKNSNHCFKAGNENYSRHQRSPCQSLSYDEDNNCHHFSKQCHSSREFTHSCNPKNVINSECRDTCSSGCCQSRNFIIQDDDTLISTPQESLEPAEIRKKRLSGKKVRTLLMDLLKGCGDCRTPSSANMSKSSVAGHTSACPPEIIVTPCSPRASCSSQSQSMEKKRCCDTCVHRNEMSAEIEAQLEILRTDMERLRSRTDALLDKFNMLKSTDIN